MVCTECAKMATVSHGTSHVTNSAVSTPLWRIVKMCYKRLQSLNQKRMQQEHSEFAQEQGTALYKSSQLINIFEFQVCISDYSGNVSQCTWALASIKYFS